MKASIRYSYIDFFTFIKYALLTNVFIYYIENILFYIREGLQNDYNRLLFIEVFGMIPKIQRFHEATGVLVIK